jgi:hypothetical protein
MRFLTFFVFCVSVLNAAAEFRAAIAVRNVTPDPLLPVSGGVGPSRPVTRKEGDLTVRALVFDQQGVRIAIVSADFLGFPSVLGNRVRAAVTNVQPSNILIGATHTHRAARTAIPNTWKRFALAWPKRSMRPRQSFSPPASKSPPAKPRAK